MRKCLFCNSTISGKHRAKEHVLRHSWLRQLEYTKVAIPIELRRGTSIVREKVIPANQILTGEVCAGCNNGWMNHLDLQVEPIVMGLAQTPGDSSSIKLPTVKARLLGRWLLKVACAHEFTDSKERRHIPRSIRSKVRRENYLPPGFLAFVVRSTTQSYGLECGSLDAWPIEFCLGHPQSTRIKFAIRYDNVILGFCYWGRWRPTFVLPSGFQMPFVSSAASYRYSDNFDYQNANMQFREQMGRPPSIAELSLITVDIDFKQN